MDSTVLHIVITAVLTLVFALVTALIWRGAQVKTVFWWIGLTMLPAGLYFLGLAPAVEGAVSTLSGWVSTVQLTPAVWAGIVLTGLSAVLLLGSRLIPSESAADRRAARKEAAKQPQKASGRPAATTGRRTPAVSSGTPGASTSQSAAGTRSQAGSTGSAGSDAEFDDIAEILRKRGIN